MQSNALFPDFDCGVSRTKDGDHEVHIPYVTAGKGPPLLLLHGFPQTRAMWHKVAPSLAKHFTVVATDIRGYGDASRPMSDSSHMPYSKRAMAADQHAVMQQLGHQKFFVLGHDRGARVAHRLALDYARAVERIMVLDVAPTLSMYEQADMTFGMRYWHWFFLVQKEPLPETLINADPEFMLRQFMGGRHAGLQAFAPAAWREYLRVARDPAAIHAMCEDYRAAATIDLDHDRHDRAAGNIIQSPLRVLWGEFGGLHQCLNPIDHWSAAACDVDGEALPCGHYIAEELPEVLVQQVMDFFLA